MYPIEYLVVETFLVYNGLASKDELYMILYLLMLKANYLREVQFQTPLN